MLNRLFIPELSILSLVALFICYRTLPEKLVVILFNGVFVCFVGTLYRRFTVWSRQGIHNVSFIPSHSDLHEYFLELKDHNITRDYRWVRKYDKWVGFYTGEVPSLFLNDPVLIKQILSDKQSFMDNVARNHGLFPDKFQPELIERTPTFYKEATWFQLRRLLVTYFTNKRLRNMHPIMRDIALKTCSELNELLGSSESDQHSIDIFGFMKECAINLNSRTLLNVSAIQLTTNIGDVFKSSFGIQERNYYFITIMQSLFGTILTFLRTFGLLRHFDDQIKNSYDSMAKVVNTNSQLSSNEYDMDFRSSLKEIRSELESSPTIDLSLITDEVINSLYFAVLTDVTTNQRNTLTYLVYLLSLHPKEQEICRKEFERQRGTEKAGGISTDSIQNNCPYAQAVFYETVRLYPGHLRRERICETENCYLDGIHIPKGTIITIPVMAMHRSEKYFETPEQFVPERFLNKKWQDMKNDGIFLGFGIGLRRCVGEKMAELATLTVLSELLMNFEFFAVKETENPIKFRNMPVLFPDNGVTVGVRKLQ